MPDEDWEAIWDAVEQWYSNQIDSHWVTSWVQWEDDSGNIVGKLHSDYSPEAKVNGITAELYSVIPEFLLEPMELYNHFGSAPRVTSSGHLIFPSPLLLVGPWFWEVLPGPNPREILHAVTSALDPVL
ncbi:hypothetical protein EDD15DRAFT_2198375 [Pisolithus albus]|nr:hypothetical protein EDD15DRAFT_2198375 [Pisolithus albus]